MKQEDVVIRERALKVVLVLVGLFFLATVYPLVEMRQEPALQMMLSIYVTLGVSCCWPRGIRLRIAA